MGCDCECHPKLESVGVLGCCFNCEREHDPLRWALDNLERNERWNRERLRELIKYLRECASRINLSMNNAAARLERICEENNEGDTPAPDGTRSSDSQAEAG